MKLCYWRGVTPNFGDELNPWLWPKLLPGFFDDDESRLFIGIGSILYHDYPASAEKIVFGSGYGGYSWPPVIDDSWTVYFVRGPRTAETLRIDPRLGVGDAATLLATLPWVRNLHRGTAGTAFMPHWESAIDGCWESAAYEAGVRYIDPRWDVEQVIAEIAASEVLVTEAMHGAIVADALRVPFVPFAPLHRHRAKWYDWGDAMGLTIDFSPAAPSTLLETLVHTFEQRPRIRNWLYEYGRRVDFSTFDEAFVGNASKAIRAAAQVEPILSTDDAHHTALDAMVDALERLRVDHQPRLLRALG